MDTDNASSAELSQLLARLSNQVEKLSRNVIKLENEVAALKQRSDEEIPEDVLIGSVRPYPPTMGNRGTVRAVHLLRHRSWSQQGRQAVQHKAKWQATNRRNPKE